MAGYREFQTGEVLTAANVNDFLMNQSVMVFADAAARTSALDGAEVEGMLTYNEDTAQLEVYDGTAFVVAAPAPPAGIGTNASNALLTAGFASSSATYTPVTGLNVSITPSTDTSKVLVMVRATLTSGNNGTIRLRLVRDSTAIGSTSAGGFTHRSVQTATEAQETPTYIAFDIIDSPGTDTSITYAVEGLTSLTNFYVGTTPDGKLSTCSITAIEVAV